MISLIAGKYKVTYNFLRQRGGKPRVFFVDEIGELWNGDVRQEGDKYFKGAELDLNNANTREEVFIFDDNKKTLFEPRYFISETFTFAPVLQAEIICKPSLSVAIICAKYFFSISLLFLFLRQLFLTFFQYFHILDQGDKFY